MKKILPAFLLALIAYLTSSCDKDGPFGPDNIQGYWVENRFHELTPQDNGEYLVTARPTDNPIRPEVVRNLLDNKHTEYISDWGEGMFYIKTKKRPQNPDLYVSDYYKSYSGSWAFVLPKINIAPKQGKDINKIIKKYRHIFTFKEYRPYNGLYVYSCDVSSSYEMLAILRDLHDRFAPLMKLCYVDMEQEISY